jgi:hypothetical protein
VSGITNTTLARLQAICDHQMGDGTTVESYLAYIAEHNVTDVDCYLDILEMQLDVLAAATRFYDKRTTLGDTQAAILCGLGGSFGMMIGRISHRQPVEGQEVASHLGQMIADRFNNFMAKWFAWRDSAPPKLPTHQPIATIN